MHLTYRAARIDDLPACLSLVRDGVEYDGPTRDGLIGLWRHLIATGACRAALIEDRGQPADCRIVGFGLSVFATDEFVHEAKTTLPPFLVPEIIARWKGGNPAFLDPDAIRRANTRGGLNILVMHYGWPTAPFTDDDRVQVRQKLIEAFLFFHRGYRINEFLQEIYGSEEANRLATVGALLRTDHSHYWAGGHAPPPDDRRPYLMGLTRDEIAGIEGNYVMSMLFFPSPPRFFFRQGEQDALCYALDGETDAQIAKSLQISPSTIKKRWEAIYERVLEIDPGILSQEPSEAPPSLKRGAERRRHLLHYIREHPEELRPVEHPPGG